VIDLAFATCGPGGEPAVESGAVIGAGDIPPTVFADFGERTRAGARTCARGASGSTGELREVCAVAQRA